MAVPTLQAQGAMNLVTTGDNTPTVPAHQADDILVASVMVWVPATASAINDIPTPANWNLLGEVDLASGDGGVAFFWRRATASGTTVTFTRGAGWDTGVDGQFSARVDVIRGCDTSGNPFDAEARSAAFTTANQNVPAITVSGAQRLCYVMGVNTVDSTTDQFTALTGYTMGTATDSTTGTGGGMRPATATFGSNQSALASTHTAPAAGRHYVFQIISFKPALFSAVNVRRFDGVDDVWRADGTYGLLNAGVAWTLLIVRRGTTQSSGDESVIAFGRSGSQHAGLYDDNVAGVVIAAADDPSVDTNVITTSAPLKWELIAANKGTASEVVRGHRKALDGGPWTHSDTAGAVANTSANATTRVQIGNFINGGGFRDMDVAVAALFDVELSDGDVEGIATAHTTQAIRDLNPIALWDFNQASTATSVDDLSAGGANDQAALTGTTVASVTDLDWTYGVSAGTTYEETGVVASAAVLSGPDVFEAVEVGTVVADTLTGGTREVALNRTGTVAADTTAAGADVAERAETGTVAADTTTPGADSWESVEAGTVAADTNASGPDVFQAVEQGAVAADTALTGDQTATLNRTGAVAADTALVGGDVAEFVETGTTTADTTLAGADSVELPSAGNVAAGTKVTGADIFEGARTGTTAADTSLSGVSEKQLGGKAGTVAAGTNATGADVFEASEVGTVSTQARVSGADVFTATETGAVVTVTVVRGLDVFEASESGAVVAGTRAFGDASTADNPVTTQPRNATIAPHTTAVAILRPTFALLPTGIRLVTLERRTTSVVMGRTVGVTFTVPARQVVLFRPTTVTFAARTLGVTIQPRTTDAFIGRTTDVVLGRTTDAVLAAHTTFLDLELRETGFDLEARNMNIEVFA